jgi:hypothetical protein
MNKQLGDNNEQMDYRTSRSICDAIGERLQQDLHPGPSRLSSYLQYLLDELRRRDREGHLRSSN